MLGAFSAPLTHPLPYLLVLIRTNSPNPIATLTSSPSLTFDHISAFLCMPQPEVARLPSAHDEGRLAQAAHQAQGRFVGLPREGLVGLPAAAQDEA